MNYIINPGKTPATAPAPLGTGDSIALNVETINLVEQPDLDFQDPKHWTLFCVPIGHRSVDSIVEPLFALHDAVMRNP